MSVLKVLLRIIAAALTLACRLLVVLTPLLGVWLASSLIALHGGPQWAAIAGGVLLFPGLPLLWELRAQRRFARRVARAQERGKDAPARVLKTVDRVIVRTLVVNGAFLAALVLLFPKPAFTALATRGDWFLDGRHDDVSNQLRTGVFAAAGALEWLHELANPNPYKKEGDDKPAPDDVKPVEETKGKQTPTPTPVVPDPRAPTPPPKADAAWTVGDTHWPHEEKVHGVVTAMPPAAETSIAAVAAHIAANEPDPFLRTKALHDWAVTRLRYDKDSLTGVRKPQDAESVFRNRLAVCEGYARLLVALGKHAGVNIVYVVGDVREDDGSAAPIGHAWNAAQIKGQWYFIDATWNDPVTPDARDIYRTDYLFTPPSVAIFDHLPDDPRWQMLAQPLDRGAFVRQPMARPGFAKLGLTLEAPDRPLVDAKGSVDVVVKNPRRLNVIIAVAPQQGARDRVDCLIANDEILRAKCALPASGRYDVDVFVGKERYGDYAGIATLGVNSR